MGFFKKSKKDFEMIPVNVQFSDIIRDIKKETNLPGTRITRTIAETYKRDPLIRHTILSAMVRRKKGSIIDFIPFLILFVVMVFVAAATIPAIDDFFENRDLSVEINETAAGNTSRLAWRGISGRGLDNILAVFFFVGHIAILILATLIRTSPVFMMINIFIILGLVLVGALMNNFVPDVITNMGITMPLVGLIFSKLVWIETVFAILTIIVLYITNRGGE